MGIGNYSGYNSYPIGPATTPVIWVDNETEARSIYVSPGSTAFLMERNNQRFYTKVTALSGETIAFKTFEFTEVAPPVAETSNSYITQTELDNAMNDLKQYIDNAFRSGNRNRNNKERNNA